MKRTLITATALAAAATVALVAPVAASASTIHPHVYASVSHSVIHKGSTVTISGSVSPKAYGHRVYLQWASSTGWRNSTSRVLNYSSRYSFTTRPGAHTNHYRIYDPAMRGHSSAVSRTLGVTAQTRQAVTLASYRGSDSWQGPRIRVPTSDYRMDYSYSCDYPAIFFNWNGDQLGFEYFESDHYNYSGTWYGHEGAMSGYFSVDVIDGCTWSMKISYTGWR